MRKLPACSSLPQDTKAAMTKLMMIIIDKDNDGDEEEDDNGNEDIDVVLPSIVLSSSTHLMF